MDYKKALGKVKYQEKKRKRMWAELPSINDVVSARKERIAKYQKRTGEQIAEFMQHDFNEQLAMYNRSVEAANKAIYRLKKSGADVSAFTELTEARELLTSEGRFKKFGKEFLEKYENASEAAKRRAEDYLLKDFAKLKTITEGVGKKEYNRLLGEKAELEKQLGLDEPLTWEQFNATRTLEEELGNPDYYALLQYAEEVEYIPDLSGENQPKLKKSEYMGFLRKVNTWFMQQKGELPTNAVLTLEDLKRLESKQSFERPRYYSKKYEETERKKRKRTGSKQLGL